jgi:rSAM/selenodomain-associated transferase 1
MSNTNVLLIFVKAPVPGRVKRRLQPEISPDDAVYLYKAMTKDIVTRFRDAFFCHVMIMCWPPDSIHEMQRWLGGPYEFIPQEGSDLGERMLHAFEGAFRNGYRKAAIIGSDIPTLTVDSVKETFSQLNSYDIVLGPSLDGGYYLIGLRGNYPKLFEGVDWGSGSVREQTLHAAVSLRLTVHQLETRRDIDTYIDATHLWKALQNPDRTVDRTHMKNTYNALQKILQKERERE